MTARQTTVNVRGTATEDVEPDYALLHGSATATADTAQSAQDQAGAIATAMRAAVESAEGVRSIRLSHAAVHELTQWSDQAQEMVKIGWQASISGTCEVDAAHAGAAAGALVGAGAQIGYVSWCLDTDNPATRRVRTAAVADARRAAEDFAAALGSSVGDLVTLADPGLLTAGGDGALRTSAPMAAYDSVGAAAKGGAIPLDAALVTVSAAVEASYLLA